MSDSGQSETSALDPGLAASTLKPDIPPSWRKGLDLRRRITEGIVTRRAETVGSASAANKARSASRTRTAVGTDAATL